MLQFVNNIIQEVLMKTVKDVLEERKRKEAEAKKGGKSFGSNTSFVKKLGLVKSYPVRQRVYQYVHGLDVSYDILVHEWEGDAKCKPFKLCNLQYDGENTCTICSTTNARGFKSKAQGYTGMIVYDLTESGDTMVLFEGTPEEKTVTLNPFKVSLVPMEGDIMSTVKAADTFGQLTEAYWTFTPHFLKMVDFQPIKDKTQVLKIINSGETSKKKDESIFEMPAYGKRTFTKEDVQRTVLATLDQKTVDYDRLGVKPIPEYVPKATTESKSSEALDS